MQLAVIRENNAVLLYYPRRQFNVVKMNGPKSRWRSTVGVVWSCYGFVPPLSFRSRRSSAGKQTSRCLWTLLSLTTHRLFQHRNITPDSRLTLTVLVSTLAKKDLNNQDINRIDEESNDAPNTEMVSHLWGTLLRRMVEQVEKTDWSLVMYIHIYINDWMNGWQYNK